MTRYAYDSQTFRLARMRTERYASRAPLAYHPTGASLQDFAYRYDVAGNITSILDRTPAGGLPNTLLGSDALDRAFSYDPLYRLLSASGRECDMPPDRPPWDEGHRCTDVTRVRGYTEQYAYDAAGNLTQMQHMASVGSFTRAFSHGPVSNRVVSVTSADGFNRHYAYTYDANGHLVRENTERYFQWDHGGRMKAYRIQVGTAEPSVHAHYLYDANGQRIKKLVRLQGGCYDVTVYVDGLFEHHLRVRGDNQQENDALHLLDGSQRIATVRVGAPFPDDNAPAVRYHAEDHLGSSNVVIDDAGIWVNREEYTPYGETSFGSFARKRYRFTGKERDEESGLYYFGARYYAPWLARWVSCDPLGMVEQANLYAYAGNRPIRFIDKIGLNSTDPPDTPSQRGAATEKAGNNLLSKKGQQNILGKQVGVGESRLDVVVGSKEGDRVAHSVGRRSSESRQSGPGS
jgi:RHS repeat-associated protein